MSQQRPRRPPSWTRTRIVAARRIASLWTPLSYASADASRNASCSIRRAVKSCMVLDSLVSVSMMMAQAPDANLAFQSSGSRRAGRRAVAREKLVPIEPQAAVNARGRNRTIFRPLAERVALAFAQSRASGCRGPHDRFRPLAASRRAIALATFRSCPFGSSPQRRGSSQRSWSATGDNNAYESSRPGPGTPSVLYNGNNWRMGRKTVLLLGAGASVADVATRPQKTRPPLDRAFFRTQPRLNRTTGVLTTSERTCKRPIAWTSSRKHMTH